jgi:hypothetical protein
MMAGAGYYTVCREIPAVTSPPDAYGVLTLMAL